MFAAGIGRSLVEAVRQRFESLRLPAGAAAADLGSGTGDALAATLADRPATGLGIDLSVPASRHAARRFPNLTWVVANADRRLPLVDGRVSFLISLHGRRNPAECARVLTEDGLLFVAVPAGDDLIELRALVQGERVARSRMEMLLKEHEALFTPVERFSTREHHTLVRAPLVDLLTSTYRGARTSASGSVARLATMDVTVASDCVVFRRARGRR